MKLGQPSRKVSVALAAVAGCAEQLHVGQVVSSAARQRQDMIERQAITHPTNAADGRKYPQKFDGVFLGQNSGSHFLCASIGLGSNVHCPSQFGIALGPVANGLAAFVSIALSPPFLVFRKFFGILRTPFEHASAMLFRVVLSPVFCSFTRLLRMSQIISARRSDVASFAIWLLLAIARFVELCAIWIAFAPSVAFGIAVGLKRQIRRIFVSDKCSIVFAATQHAPARFGVPVGDVPANARHAGKIKLRTSGNSRLLLRAMLRHWTGTLHTMNPQHNGFATKGQLP